MIKYFPPVRTSYRAADAVQQKMSRALLDFKKNHPLLGPNAPPHPPTAPTESPPTMALLAFEMHSTYTLGRRQKAEVASELANSIGSKPPLPYEIVETLRGGHTTFHGPGQLVLYPILDLQRLGIKVREYVCMLEKSIVSVLRDCYQINAEQRPGAGMNGVWIANAALPQKIASVGVHVRRNVTSHGLALNVDMDSFWFRQIVPCNLPGTEMVSMAQFTTQKPDLATVSNQLVQELARRLGVQIEIQIDSSES